MSDCILLALELFSWGVLIIAGPVVLWELLFLLFPRGPREP